MERRKHRRHPITLPLEYWGTDDSFQGGLVSNLSEGGLLIHSVRKIPVGRELNVRVFFSDGYKFDGFRGVARVLWGKLHHETDWRIYEFGLVFTRISEADRRKLIKLINSHLATQGLSTRRGIGVRNPQSEKPSSYPSVSLDRRQEKEGIRGQ